MKKIICVESPWTGLDAGQEATIYLARAIQFVVRKNFIPIASHAMFCVAGQIPDTEENRILGLVAGRQYIELADAVWLFTDYGISPGMSAAMRYAFSLNKRVEAKRIGQNHEGI